MDKCPINEQIFNKCIDDQLSLPLKVEILNHLKEKCAECDRFFTINGTEKRIILESLIEATEEELANTHSYNDFKKESIFRNILNYNRESYIDKLWRVAHDIVRKPAYIGAFATCIIGLFIFFIHQNEILDNDTTTTHYSGLKGVSPLAINLTAKYAEATNNAKTIIGEVKNNMDLKSSNDIIFNFHITQDNGYVYLFLTLNNITRLIYPQNPSLSVAVKKGENPLLINGREGAFVLQDILQELNISSTDNFTYVTARFCAMVFLNPLTSDELLKLRESLNEYQLNKYPRESVSCLNINVIK